MDTTEVRRLKIILLVSSLVSLVLLVLSAYEEHFSGTWRQHQLAYREAALASATSETARAGARAIEIRFRQVFLPQINRVDRCTTCHIGIDDPGMTSAEQPIRTHSGEILAHHPVDKFGCTVCHDGQPRAIKLEAAHGEVEGWAQPLLTHERVYTNCSRCHYEADLFGAEEDLYARGGERKPLYQAELASFLPGGVAGRGRHDVSGGAAAGGASAGGTSSGGTAVLAVGRNPNAAPAGAIARGKQLVLESGCLGCHKYRGRGGTLGPDITYVGDKTAHDFDFSYLPGEHSVERWLTEHFRNPAQVSPTTLMPDFGFTEEQIHDLMLFMRSLKRKSMPAAYTPVSPRHAGRLATGGQLFEMFCAACHGKNGQGNTAREYNEVRAIDAPPELMVPSLNHAETLAVASDDYLRAITANGRPATNMLGWADEGGLRDDEIDRLVQHVRSWQPRRPDSSAIAAARGDARIGRSIYFRNCAACHGPDGEGGVGNTLNSRTFLAVASDEFLAETIITGRPNTAMPSWRELGGQQVSDLLAYLRTWHPRKNDRETTMQLVADSSSASGTAASASGIVGGAGAATGGTAVSAVNARIGKTLYRANCVTCHGQNGEGDLAPSLNTQEFLTIVSDEYLYETIAYGRPGTGMPAWRHFSAEDLASLIVYIRTWQSEPSRTLPRGRIAGDWDTGRRLYGGACASCHGQHAEGVIGPQLNNPVFLRSASDAMLKEWIRYGKLGTPMRGFIKGGQGTAELRERQIDDIVAYVRSLEFKPRVSVAKRPSGRPELGRLWYAVSCAPCHGDAGEGASGPALGNPGFLHAASDGFLMATMALGRDGTEMRPVKKGPQSILSLSSDQVNDVVAYLRSWEYEPPTAAIAHRYVVPWDLQRGRRMYESNCAGCHGIEGKGELDDPARFSAWAPNLNNQGFLAAATDGFLQATIVRGRSGTAMRPFGHGAQGIVDLSSDDIDDIVAYIRRWSDQPGLPITIPAEIEVAGDADASTADTAVPLKMRLPVAVTPSPLKGD